jgi:hypothetical protein
LKKSLDKMVKKHELVSAPLEIKYGITIPCQRTWKCVQ